MIDLLGALLWISLALACYVIAMAVFAVVAAIVLVGLVVAFICDVVSEIINPSTHEN